MSVTGLTKLHTSALVNPLTDSAPSHLLLELICVGQSKIDSARMKYYLKRDYICKCDNNCIVPSRNFFFVCHSIQNGTVFFKKWKFTI